MIRYIIFYNEAKEMNNFLKREGIAPSEYLGFSSLGSLVDFIGYDVMKEHLNSNVKRVFTSDFHRQKESFAMIRLIQQEMLKNNIDIESLMDYTEKKFGNDERTILAADSFGYHFEQMQS